MTEFLIETCTADDRKTIVSGINSFNLSKVSALGDTWLPVEFTIKNKQGDVIAGILGGIGYWNGLEISILWVDDNYRGKGLGKQLLKHAEQFAANKGAVISILDTFDFQAEAFYLKNGYEAIGEIKNFPQGHRRIYFSKRLTA